MEYLKIKRGVAQLRTDGSRFAIIAFITKSERFGKTLSEKNISVKKSIFLTGEPNSGKTRCLTRLHEYALEIWGTKSKTEPLFLDARSPLESWGNTATINQWWESQHNKPIDWSHLQLSKHLKILTSYCADTGAVLFIDDAHKLSSSKLKIALECVKSARIWVVATYKEEQVPPKLLKELMQYNPQQFHLQTSPIQSKKWL